MNKTWFRWHHSNERRKLTKYVPSKTDYGCLSMWEDLFHTEKMKRWNRKTATNVGLYFPPLVIGRMRRKKTRMTERNKLELIIMYL